MWPVGKAGGRCLLGQGETWHRRRSRTRKNATPSGRQRSHSCAWPRKKGLDLTGPDGLLKQFTKSVLETALDEEMTEHLGRAKHKKSKDGRAANTRNGTTAKTVVTDSVGPVRIEVPRDRAGARCLCRRRC